MVKLYVPFLFFLHKVRYQTHPAPRIEIQSKLSCTSLEKREWNGGIGVCAAMKAPVGLLSHKAVLRKQDGAALPRQTWGPAQYGGIPHRFVFTDALAEASAFLVQRSQLHQLDLSNLVARTEYHSRLVLSTPICKF